MNPCFEEVVTMIFNNFHKNRSEYTLKGVFYTILTLGALSTLIPMLLLVSTSLSSEDDVIKNGYPLFPRDFSLMSYKSVLLDPLHLLNAYMITIIVTVVGSILSLMLVSTIGYVMARPDYKYKRILAFYVFFTLLFHGGLVPNYILVSNWLGLKDNLFSMIVPLLISAWNILLMKGFMQSIPISIVESAKIDGASEFKTFLRIILPLSKPALATLGLFIILAYWNDWYNSMLYIENSNLYNLQYLLVRVIQNNEFLNTSEIRGMLNLQAAPPVLTARMAMCVLAAGPMLVIFPFFQKYFVKGITMGSIK
jgi:putative aldouronate transport system permease protein